MRLLAAPRARLGPLVVAAALAGVACAHAPGVSTAGAAGSTAALPRLEDVFARVTEARSAGRPALAVFEIDGTLLDPAARTRDILTAALDGPGAVVDPPREDLAAKLRGLALSEYEYDAEATLAEVGITDTAFVRALMTRWRQDFYSNRFLLRDTSVPGASPYVDSLYARGCTIVYLTRRDAPRMLGGTAQCLLERGFPVGILRTMLVLKPERTTADLQHEQGALDQLAAYGTVVAVFQSEPAGANLLHERFPAALAFCIEAKHSASAPALATGITQLPDYSGFRVP